MNTGESESGDGAVPNGDPTYVMTKEHAAAFKKVGRYPALLPLDKHLCELVLAANRALNLCAAGDGEEADHLVRLRSSV